MTTTHFVRPVSTRRTALLIVLLVPFLAVGAGTDRLTSRPRPATPSVKPVAVGDELRTDSGQRRRVVLPDGSVVYLNQQTTVKLTADRHLKLSRGEVFVEVAPRDEKSFVVETTKREVSAVGTAFAVRASEKGTGILVARGRVKVSGLDRPLHAGQLLAPDADKPEAAPRAAHALAWARELVEASESPLVPRSQHAGGSLVAVDPNGQEARLSLRKYHVDVHIEDGFARTTIDQTYFNHHAARLEGTFHFPLPADASLSRLAMYVDGTRMEGGMVDRDYGRNVYERIVESQRDPALLEWVDGTTFKMRVFPLEPRQEKRILLSYTQKLPTLYGQASYRFPAGHSLDRVGQWSFHAHVKDGATLAWESASHGLTPSKDKGDLLLDASQKDAKLDRDVVLTLGPPPNPPPPRGEGRVGAREGPRFSSMEQDGAKYLMVRWRPEMPVQPVRQRRDWVFLFESSGDRDPLLARTQVELVRGLLQNAEPDDTFTVVTASTRPRLLAKELRPVTPPNVSKALAFLEEAHLIGALDLDRGLGEAVTLLKDAQDPYLVHVGSGIAAMGEQRTDALVKRIPEGVHYVGIGVGRRWNRAFMKAAAEKSGGYLTQVNPDESVSWRAFELSGALNTPRLLDISVSDDTGKNRYLTFASMVGHGEEVCSVTRLDGGTLPERVKIRGEVNRRLEVIDVRVQDVGEGAGYLPRTWAKLEIERLLAENAVKHKESIVALSKAMYVMTPFTSLLVLENEAMYQQFKVDRGRKDHWAMYPAPDKVPVFYEDEDGNRIDPKKAARPTPKQVLETVLTRKYPDVITTPTELSAIDAKPLLELSLPDEPMVMFPPTVQWGSLTRTPPRFLGLQRGHLNAIQADEANNARRERISGINQVRSRSGATRRTERETFVFEGLSDAEKIDGAVAMPRAQTQAMADLKPLGIFELGGMFRPESGVIAEYARNKAEQPLFVAGSPQLVTLKVRSGEAEAAARSLQETFGNSRLRVTASGNSTILVHANPDDIATISRLLTDTMASEGESGSLVFRRPSYSGDDRLFYDLVSYAPGMNTSRADVLAVLEAETTPGLFGRPGRIDDVARRLFEKARPTGWQSLQIPADGDQPALTITFDRTGRYAYERTLPPGIRERVVCDGKTLLHLYPDLHIGARRSVSRHHRLDFARLVPWALPRAEDLARGADVKLLDEKTVAVVPHGAGAKDEKGKEVPYIVNQFVFADEGRLTEQRVVVMPSKKVFARVVLGEGGIRILDDKDKEIVSRKGKLSAAKAPDLLPDVKELVVLPLPYRSREQVVGVRKLKDVAYQNMSFDDALALFAAEFGAGRGEEALKVFKEGFHGRDQRQLGFYVLLAGCGQNLDAQNLDVLAEHPDAPLAQYLALHSSAVLRKHASQWAAASAQWGGFLRHLAVTHSLLQRWSNARVLEGDPKALANRLAQAVEYVEKNRGTDFGFALLSLMQARAAEARHKKDATQIHAALAKLWPLFDSVPGLETAAKYEHARSLWKSGQRDEARKRFVALYEEARKQDALLLFDADFRHTLLGSGDEKDLFSPLLRDTAKRLVEKKRRSAVLALAQLCRHVDDETLAADLLAVALDGISDKKERLRLTSAAVEFLRETGQFTEAERLLRPLLDDAEQGKRAALWRLAARIASERDNAPRELECLERALAAEFRDLPEVVNLEVVRRDYGRLLTHYQDLADAMATLKVEPPRDFAAKVVRTADRWRSLDRDQGDACRQAARVLRKLGGETQRELAWDYLTTPVGLRPNESGPWAELAGTLQKQGELALADQAFASAFAAEPTNAQLLWERAQNLRQAGRLTEARKLLQQLADGPWQPRFEPVQRQARWQVDNR